MKKVFLDCGTNLCQGLEQISKENGVDESWEVFSFDANPEVFKVIDLSKYPHVNFINEGVWIEDCEKLLSQEVLDYVSKKDLSSLTEDELFNSKIGGASNIIGEDYQWGAWIKKENIMNNSLSVKCFDLGKFIKEKFDKEDFIILKLDIEGAEYEIMEKMLIDGSIDYVKSIYIEWHNTKTKSSSLKRKYIDIFAEKGIKYTEWY